MNRSMFIVFEGADGSGKTTVMNSFAKYLEKNGDPVVVTKEPWSGHQSSYMWIRKILDKKIEIKDRNVLEFILLCNRYRHNIWVKKRLKEGFNIVQDRSWISSIAYQEMFSMDFIIKINSKFEKIDILFFVDTPAKECIRRIEARGSKKTLYEKEQKLESANQKYNQFIQYCNKMEDDVRPYIQVYTLNGIWSRRDLFLYVVMIWGET